MQMIDELPVNPVSEQQHACGRATTTILITATLVARDGCNVDSVSYGRDADSVDFCSNSRVHGACDDGAADAMLARLSPLTGCNLIWHPLV
jgi:hypothetical protein